MSDPTPDNVLPPGPDGLLLSLRPYLLTISAASLVASVWHVYTFMQVPGLTPRGSGDYSSAARPLVRSSC